MKKNLKDITGSKDIKLLIDSFYKQVLTDETIGHFFTKVVPINFDKHIPIMYSFWENVLFYTGEYKRNPMIKHIEISKKAPLTQEHFNKWLSLWTNNVDNLFAGTKAEEAKSKANQIGKMMLFNIAKS
jgi:hemoglobin